MQWCLKQKWSRKIQKEQDTVAAKLWVFMILFHTRSGSKKLGKKPGSRKKEKKHHSGKMKKQDQLQSMRHNKKLLSSVFLQNKQRQCPFYFLVMGAANGKKSPIWQLQLSSLDRLDDLEIHGIAAVADHKIRRKLFQEVSVVP